MNIFKNVLAVLAAAIFVITTVLTSTYLVEKYLIKKDTQEVVEKVIVDLKKQDSLLNVISILEDSLSKKKTERIKQIDTVYEKTIDSIRTLNPTQQVELLARNLSKINGN
jgi:hypothetical protein